MASGSSLEALVAWAQSTLHLSPEEAKAVAASILKKQGGGQQRTGGKPIGTISKRTDGLYRKTGPGVWEKVEGKEAGQSKEAPKEDKKKKDPTKPEGVQIADIKDKGELSALSERSPVNTGAVANDLSSKAMGHELNINPKKLSKDEQRLLSGVTLFTAGNVNTVRDPNNFDKEAASSLIDGSSYRREEEFQLPSQTRTSRVSRSESSYERARSCSAGRRS